MPLLRTDPQTAAIAQGTKAQIVRGDGYKCHTAAEQSFRKKKTYRVGYERHACRRRYRTIPYELIEAGSALLVVCASEASLGRAWDVFSVVASGTRSNHLPAFEVPIRGRDFPVTHVNGDGIRLCKGDGKSCCEDLEDEHWVGSR